MTNHSKQHFQRRKQWASLVPFPSKAQWKGTVLLAEGCYFYNISYWGTDYVTTGLMYYVFKALECKIRVVLELQP